MTTAATTDMTTIDTPLRPSRVPAGSRWRDGGEAVAARGAGGRVRGAQRAAREAFAVTAVFALVAAVALIAPHTTGRWLPIHAFLAGGLVCAISGASLLFAVTWSAGPAP